ncbi:MAG: hypothetical protein RJB28_674, partial [Actinomycetota bacterium]
ERLIIVLVSAGFAGLNIPSALEIGAAILAIASLITVGQRLLIVYRTPSSRNS